MVSGGLTRYLRESDLEFLVRTVADKRQDHDRVKEIIRDKEDLIEIMLEDEKLMRKVRQKEEELLFISPYFLFNILLRQVRRQLRERGYTFEFSGQERIAVFDADRLNELLKSNELINCLAEVLSSFTRVQTGFLFYWQGEKLKRQKFNSLNPQDLIALGNLLPEEERFPVYRRLGDLCLFMAGIFPDYARRPGQSLRLTATRLSLEEYRELGSHYYSLAARHPVARREGLEGLLDSLASNFALVIKPLNVLASDYIGLRRNRWFGV